MLFVREPGRSPIYRLVARVLIAALVTASIPATASASMPAEPSSLTKTAFGELIAHTGTDPQPYAFAGEPYDPNSGFQYHRARWMDPRSGRLLGVDRLSGSTYDPTSLHRYLYASANPVDFSDPSGYFTQQFGYDVEDAIEPLYAATHLGDAFTFGKWNRVGENPRLKPDVLNYSRCNYMEIKPLSYSGVAGAILKMALYGAALTPVGFYPDHEWEPPNGGLIMVGRADVLVFNILGVLFYTDALGIAQDLVEIKAFSDLYRLLRSSRMATSVIYEGARITRLAAGATAGSQTRIDSAMGNAILLATLGVF